MQIMKKFEFSDISVGRSSSIQITDQTILFLLLQNTNQMIMMEKKKHEPREKILLFSNQRQLFFLFCLWIEAFNAIIDPIKSLTIPFLLDIFLSHGVHNLCDNLSFNGMKIPRNSWVAHISRAWCYQFFHKFLHYTNFIVSIIFNRKITSFWNFFNKNSATHSLSKSRMSWFHQTIFAWFVSIEY